MTPWWKTDSFIINNIHSREEWISWWFDRVFVLSILNNPNCPPIQERYWSGNIEDDDLTIFHEFFQEKLGAILLKYDTSHNSHNWFYAWKFGFFVFNFETNTNHANLDIRTVSEKDLDNIEKICEQYFKKLHDEEPGRIYILGETERGLKLFELGYAGVPFEKENYDEDVSKDFDFIVEELESTTPSGRLVLLGGPPGTGKTYFLRGLINQVKKALFVFIPAQMVSQLGNPSFVTTLLETAEDEEGGTIILVVEDADSVLVTRGSDNMSSISSLLNLTSGLLGDLIDIRVIATTNAKKLDIDKAITRSGRLSKHIAIENISEYQAQKVFSRLTGKNDKYEGSPRLGEVYQKARECGWVPPCQQDDKSQNTKKSKHIAKKYRKGWKYLPCENENE